MKPLGVYFFILSLFVGCSVTSTPQTNLRIQKKPSWINGKNVGYALLLASGNQGKQKSIAIKRAIVQFMFIEGKFNGKSVIKMNRIHKYTNATDMYSILYNEKGIYGVEYHQNSFQVKIINQWNDEYNGIYYIQVEKIE